MMKRLFAVAALAMAVACGGQSAICKKYQDCTEAILAGSFSSLEATYGASGSCWSNATSADVCNAACQTAVDALKQGNANVTACQ